MGHKRVVSQKVAILEYDDHPGRQREKRAKERRETGRRDRERRR